MGTLLTGVEAEESFGFSVSGTSEEEDVLSGGGDLGELIESEALAFCGDDSLSGFGSELEGTNSEASGDSE